MPLNEMQERWIRDLKYLEENHAKEIENYEKYFNKEVFNKIIEKIKSSDLKVTFDNFYDDDNKILGNTMIFDDKNDGKIYFKLFDFNSFDGIDDMECYLKGELYYLEINLPYDILSYNELKESFEFINKVKNIIDSVLKEI